MQRGSVDPRFDGLWALRSFDAAFRTTIGRLSIRQPEYPPPEHHNHANDERNYPVSKLRIRAAQIEIHLIQRPRASLMHLSTRNLASLSFDKSYRSVERRRFWKSVLTPDEPDRSDLIDLRVAVGVVFAARSLQKSLDADGPPV